MHSNRSPNPEKKTQSSQDDLTMNIATENKCPVFSSIYRTFSYKSHKSVKQIINLLKDVSNTYTSMYMLPQHDSIQLIYVPQKGLVRNGLQNTVMSFLGKKRA